MPQRNAFDVEIREFQQCDDMGVREVSKEAHAFLRKFYLRKSSSAPTEIPYVRLVAVSGGKIVGTITYEKYADHIYFGSMGVLGGYRRRGVGRAMVAHLERLCSTFGIGRLVCSTVVTTGNVEIFERLGFVKARRELSEYFVDNCGQPAHEVYLEKHILKK